MKEILFKNGEKIEVPVGYANHLSKKILSGTANDFQCFYEGETTNTDVQMVIRISEIVYIR